MPPCAPTCICRRVPRIKLRLVKFEKAIAIQVLEQDLRYLSDGPRPSFEASNGFSIRSDEGPDVCVDTLYLRGDDRSMDLDVETRHFVSNSERDAYVDRMTTALREWAEKAPQFGNDSAGAPANSDDQILSF